MAKKKVGPRKWMPTEAQVARLGDLAKFGMTLEMAAYSLGIHYTTLNARFNELPELRTAWEKGKAKAIELVGSRCYELALKGDRTAMPLYLKCVGRWTERHEHTGATGGPIEVKHSGKGLTIQEANSIASILAEASRAKKK